MKKFVYIIGFGAAMGYSYYRGYIKGQEQAMNDLESETEDLTNSNPDSSAGFSNQDETNTETTTVETTTQDTTSKKSDSDETVPCEDEDCEKAFDTEQGAKIHYGRVHKD